MVQGFFCLVILQKNKQEKMSIQRRVSLICFLLCLINETMAKDINTTENDSAKIIQEIDKKDAYQIEEDTTDIPKEVYTDFIKKAGISTFSLPIEINLKTIQNIINNQYKTDVLLYQDNNIEDDDLKMKAWKKGTFVINVVGNKITAEIPIKIWLVKRVSLGIAGNTDREAQGSIKIKLESTFSFSKNWYLITSTKLLGYDWIEKPTLKVAGMNVPVTYVADKLIEKNKTTLETMVDEQIKKNIPLHSYAQNFWKEMQKPISIPAGNYPGWLKLEPQSLVLTPINGENGLLKTTFKTTSNIEYCLGIVPIVSQYKPMPSCSMVNKIEPGFNLKVMIDIPYSILDSIMRSNLTNQNIGNEKHPIIVDNVRTYGNEDKVAIELQVHGFIKGKIYANAIPYYLPENESIKLKDVQYKLKTKNLLHKAINFIVKPLLKYELEKKFEVSLKDKFDSFKQTVQTNILNNKWANNIYTGGNLKNITVGEISICKSGLQVDISALGDVKGIVK